MKKTNPSFSTRRSEILAISRSMIAAQEEQTVTECLVDGLSSLMHYDTVAVYISNEIEQTLDPIIVQGPRITNPDLRAWSISTRTGIIGSVVANGSAECINHAQRDPRSVYPSGVSLKEEHVMVFPLRQGDKCWGALAINRTSPTEFTIDEFHLAEFLASYASLALNNTTLIRKLREKDHDQMLMLRALPDQVFRLRKNGPHIELIGKSGKARHIHSLIPPKLADLYQDHLEKVLHTKEQDQFEFDIRAGAEINYYEARLVYINATECLAVVRNLTETKEVRKQLEKAEALKRVIVDTLSDVVITTDKKGVILFVNEVAPKIFGYTTEELIGQSLDLLIPDYLKAVHHQAMRNYVETGKRHLHSWIGLELPGLHKNKSEVPIEVSFGETSIDGEPIFSAIIRDISLRKKEEAHIKSVSTRLSKLLQTMQAGVLVEDEDRKIVLCNEQFCSMFGINAPPEALIGSDCSGAAEESKGYFKDPTAFVERITELLNNQALATSDELELVDGRTYDRDYVPIFVGEEYKGHMWVYRDITHRKKNEAELMQAKQEAEHSMKAKQDFLARMSHELRTPINGVLGLTNLMLTSQLSKENSEYLKGIRSSGEHLLALINDILDLAKIEAGRLEVVSKPFSPRKELESLVENLGPLAQEKGLELSFSATPNIPKRLLGDVVRVNQVLMNLVSNAIKFTEQGHVKIRCTGEHKAHQFQVQFEVEDTGIGIPSERLDAIFESFTQADQQTSIKYGGTGLGLSIVRDLAHLMGGKVSVESHLKVGSTFRVTLPFDMCEEQLDEELRAPSVQAGIYSNFSDCRVLVAEDNPINQLVVRNTLKQWDIDVTVVGNGLEALQKLRDEKFELVIMDVQMPEMDGLEATRRIRQDLSEPARSIPIIAMTASVLYDPAGRVKEAGMDDYLPKPFKVEDLYTKLTRYLATSKQPTLVLSQQCYINLDYLRAISPDSPEFILEMLQLFEKQSATFLENAKKQFIDENYQTLSRTSHAFKPQGAYLGVESLKNIVGDLELVAAEGKDVDRMAGLIAQSEILIEAMLEEIIELKLNLK